MRSWGLPYVGSKSPICHHICRILPKAENFYDLFGGGFSITHWMLINRFDDYKRFYFNEKNSSIVDFIKDAIDGKFNYNVFNPPWVSREEFFSKRHHDGYVQLIWCYFRKFKNYFFSPSNEKLFRSVFNAVVFNEFDSVARDIIGISRFDDGMSIKERRLFVMRKTFGKFEIKPLGSFERVQRLEDLKKTNKTEKLQITSLSYEEVFIKPNSVVYCDIPYKTAYLNYFEKFDYKAFYQWAASIPHPVFISEYEIKDKRFFHVLDIKRNMYAPSAIHKKNFKSLKTDRVFCNAVAYELLMGAKID